MPRGRLVRSDFLRSKVCQIVRGSIEYLPKIRGAVLFPGVRKSLNGQSVYHILIFRKKY
jgi:hypothetical protein